MSNMVTGILLVIVGFYSALRGFVMTKPFYPQFTFRGALELLVGVAGYYAVALGTFFHHLRTQRAGDMKLTRDYQYKQVCKEIRDLKIFLGLSRVSDEDILGSTPVMDDAISPFWVFSMKELVRLIKKKQEYDSDVQQPACEPATATT